MTMNRMLVAAVALAAAACAHKKPVASPQAPAPPEPAAAVAAVPAPPPVAPQACMSDAQCASNELCLSGACAPITPSLAACGVSRVHFDYDEDVLHPAELPILERMARCIGANQPSHVLIVGSADERGTVEYNLALGERRADAVRRYLAGLGVGVKGLELVSYGKELPLCTEHTEVCWQQNRRASIRPGEEPKDIAPRIRQDEAAERARATGG